MRWTIEVSVDAEQDLELLFRHLADSYLDFGASRSEAADKALSRVQHIRDNIDRLATAPHRGEAHEDILPGLRHLTLEKAIYWFVVEEEIDTIRVLATFHGGQDHQRRMLIRLLGDQL